jgi:ABC-type Fe3+ transport system permease subunit
MGGDREFLPLSHPIGARVIFMTVPFSCGAGSIQFKHLPRQLDTQAQSLKLNSWRTRDGFKCPEDDQR